MAALFLISRAIYHNAKVGHYQINSWDLSDLDLGAKYMKNIVWQ